MQHLQSSSVFRPHFTAVLSLLAVMMLAGCPQRPDAPNRDGGEIAADGGEPAVNPPSGCAVQNVEVTAPLANAELKEGAAPNFSCHDTPEVFRAIGNSTIEGCVDIFGIGGNARAGLKLAIFDIDQNPQDDTPNFGEVDIAVQSQAGPLQALAADCSKGGFYRIEGVATHKPLIIKVHEAVTGPTQIAIPSYTYGVVFYDADTKENGAIEYEASLIYKSTYDSIPTLGGKRIDGQQNIYDGIGRAVLAGEVRDCDGKTVKNAAVGTSLLDTDTVIRYFNGNEDDPAPDLSLDTTNDDGLYVVLNANTAPGSNEHLMIAAILDDSCSGDDCQCKALGAKTLMAFPDSVTLISFERPFPIIDPTLPNDDAGVIAHDAGMTLSDAGVTVGDAGPHDAGITLADAGLHDAGSHDAGITLADAGLHDAGLHDAGNADAGNADAGN